MVEDVNKNFRYAALNLASLHARLGHNEEALAAVKVVLQIRLYIVVKHGPKSLTLLYKAFQTFQS